MQAEDLAFWQITAPDVVEEIKNNPLISVMKGIYSHMMPSFFPGYLTAQLSQANKVFKKILGEKVSKFGCLPEVDITSKIIPQLKNAGWGGSIILKDFQYTYEYFGESGIKGPMIDKAVIKSCGMPLLVGTAAAPRNVYLKFLRGYADMDEFINALTIDAEAQNGLVNFFTDAESFIINSKGGEPRYDKMEEFFACLKNSPLDFVLPDDKKTSIFIENNLREANECEVVQRLNAKWYHSPQIYQKIVQTLNSLPDKSSPTALSLTISDIFSAIHYNKNVNKIELPIEGTEEKVIIRSDYERRMAALQYFMAKATSEVPPVINEPALKWFLENLEKAHLV